MKTDQRENKEGKIDELEANLLIGPGGYTLIDAAKRYRADMAKIRLAEMIEEAMEKEGLNQTELAKFLNVSKQAVNKMLNGSTNFTVETLIRLEEVLYSDFISSALYKDEAMRREYGVHFNNSLVGVSDNYISPIGLIHNPNTSIGSNKVFETTVSSQKFSRPINEYANAA